MNNAHFKLLLFDFDVSQIGEWVNVVAVIKCSTLTSI